MLLSALAALGIAAAFPGQAKTAPKAKVVKPAGKSSAKTDAKHAGKRGGRAQVANATAASRPDMSADADGVTTQEGVGSWYGGYFHGRQTASGEIFNMHAYTAAHRSLPIPSFARVRNLNNGREVIVRINDRGPYVGHRVIDLSMAAASRLGIQGIGRVRIEPLPADAIHNGQWRLEDGRPGRPNDLALANNGRAGAQAPRADQSSGRAEQASAPSVPPTAAHPTEHVAAPPPGGEADAVAAHGEMQDARAVKDTPVPADVAALGIPPEDTPDGFEAMATAPGASLPRSTTRNRPAPASAANAHRDTGGHPAPAREAKEVAFIGPMPAATAIAGTDMGPPAPVLAAASAAALPAVVVAEAVTPAVPAPRDVVKTEEPPAPKPIMSSLLAGVAATVTPVLTGLARSAAGVKETVIGLASSKPNTKPGSVQIDPARTSNGRGWWVQLGAFDQSSHAMRFQHKVIEIAPWLSPLLGIFDEKGEQKLQAGPYPTREQAQSALERARDALKTTPVMVQRR